MPCVPVARLGEQALQLTVGCRRHPTAECSEQLEVASAHLRADAAKLDDPELPTHEREPARHAASAAPRSVAGSPSPMYSSSIARNGPLTSSLPRMALMPHTTRSRITKVGGMLSASITRWCGPWTSNIFVIVSIIHWRENVKWSVRYG